MDKRDFPLLNAYLADCEANDLPQWPEHSESGDELLAYYEQLFAMLESRLWKEGLNRELLASYQALTVEFDQQLQGLEDDGRHHFIVVIPVADRPQHLKSCLESLLHLCETFPYGRKPDGTIGRISVLIADDSREPTNIREHLLIAESVDARGLPTYYFGQEQQLQTMNRLTDAKRQALRGVLGDFDASIFNHKGASIMRNITYLKLAEMVGQYAKPLFFFVDSDQEFRVKIQTEKGDEDVYALNYFFNLDRIFSRTKAAVVTGKVVGDPPVSPSVMASNFLGDVSAFLLEMANYEREQECRFHGEAPRKPDGAVYHDMADLFGFQPSKASFQYRCVLEGNHDHQHCFQDFSRRLKQFFDGVHPTRKTYYEYADVLSGVMPARTVYTGNYVFNRAGLAYFIPFATRKLRMAGPTLGRILAAELGDRFLSDNLPMLHKRTVAATGRSEFRPGIVHEEQLVDLSGELERQYYGDVMLFSMEALTESGYPQQTPTKQEVLQILQHTESRLRKKYEEKHLQIQEKLDRLAELLFEESNWWVARKDMQSAIDEVSTFVANVRYNFGVGARGLAYIQSRDHRRQRLQQMTQSIFSYGQEKAAWDSLLNRT